MIINRSRSISIVIIAIMGLFFGSCISNKRITYLQEKQASVAYTDTITFNRNLYKLQAHDIVKIDVETINDEFRKYFMASNNSLGNLGSVGGMNGGDMFYTIGYSLDDSGYINFPMLGSVHVAGLTLGETREKIEKELQLFQVDARVDVRIGGLRVTLLGEFYRPGKYVVLQNQLTIFEALALGGDLKEIANREKVTLLRQYPTGVQIHYIDVLDKNIINSPFYFLQPNDLIYVEPLKRRAYGVGVNGLQTLSTALTLLTTTLLILNYVNR